MAARQGPPDAGAGLIKLILRFALQGTCTYAKVKVTW